MKQNIKILDCTLRDGGRIINCEFSQFHINGIIRELNRAKIDIIEVGFLRSKMKYNDNSTFFTEMDQLYDILQAKDKYAEYVLFTDYGEEYGGWDFNKLPPCDDNTVKGIRLGFRKNDLDSAINTMRLIKDQGYNLYIQMIETLNYSDLDFLRALEKINALGPYAVGIVDTFGRMYKNDLLRFYTLADHNLFDNIYIDFHTHNNMQLSFALAQEVVTLSHGKRNLILDATLNGMGKAAGNLNTELIVDYLNRQYGYNYDFDAVCDAIDDHILWIKKEHFWGYSLPDLMSGIFSSHPNNVNYLQSKNRLRSKDIRYILSMVDAETRKRYDYDNLDQVYYNYSSSKYDDNENLQLLKSLLFNKTVLIIVFGKSIRDYSEKIKNFINSYNPVIIGINHSYKEYQPDFVFYGNHRRYCNDNIITNRTRKIVSSNISTNGKEEIVVEYCKLVSVGFRNYDNSTIMLLNLLRNIGVSDIFIAGLDGFTNNESENYYDEIFSHNSIIDENDEIRNEELKMLLKEYRSSLKKNQYVRFVTPSRFESLFVES